ncbi:DUF1896 family protein [Ferruginibacter sp.]|nr:DUF1896 family protein [Ferruginibacter sp.]
MQEILLQKLQQYISQNNPDLLFQLEQESKLTEYLTDKVSTVKALIEQAGKGQPHYIIEETCMDILTMDLKPSRYNYIRGIFEEEFEKNFLLLSDTPLLQTEVINMISYCKEVFNEIGFTAANEDDPFLRYNIIGAISEYVESNSEKEIGGNELQQSTAFTP